MSTTPFFKACASSLLTLAVATGCGGGASSSSSGGGGAGGTTTTSPTGGTGGDGGATTGGTGGDGGATTGGTGGTTTTTTTTSQPTDCTGFVDAIAQQTTGVWTCTTIVRLDYQTLAIKAYRILCSDYAPVTEAEARATSESVTGYGENDLLLSGATPADEFVFYQSPGDFGGVGAVNARNAQPVFGAGIVWLGTGMVTYPATFGPAGEIGYGCENVTPHPPARGWDLRDASGLSDYQIDAALDAVWTTAVPDGLMQGGYVFDAVVLLYPPTMGAFDPTVAEWVVMLNSGWLE